MPYAHLMRPRRTVSPLLSHIHAYITEMHCLIFGAPPLTTITLPPTPVPLWSLNLAIVNEGDPIPRADAAYVEELLEITAEGMPTPHGAVVRRLPAREMVNAGIVLVSNRSCLYFLTFFVFRRICCAMTKSPTSIVTQLSSWYLTVSARTRDIAKLFVTGNPNRR